LSLKIPEETPSGREFRLKGQGMPILKRPGQFGDLYVQVEAVLPKNLTEEEKKLFRQLAAMRQQG